MTRNEMGWSPFFEAHLPDTDNTGLIPARVVREQRRSYHVLTETGEFRAEVSGRFAHEATGRGQFPAVGDWVLADSLDQDTARIQRLLPRRTKFSRKLAGATTEEQVVAANVDTVLLVAGLDHDFNLRRMERYLTTAWESGANPVIVLNKADRSEALAERMEETGRVAMGVPLHAVSALTGEGMARLHAYCMPGKTLALLGSSGVGKSSLLNALAGNVLQDTQAVREDDSRGRHTTTHRELFFLEGGAMIIDTPGMREILPWADEDAVSGSFADVEGFAEACRFRDCTHQGEPGCAVEAAVATGELDAARLKSYFAMRKEAQWLERRQDARAAKQEEQKWRQIKKGHRQKMRFEERNRL